jgi:tyrosine-protein phosphatase SIW14
MKDFFSALLLTSILFSPRSSFAQSTVSAQASASHSAISSSVIPVAPISFAQKLTVRGVPNAGKVSEQLYRGAQPDLDRLAELKKLGVTTIVDLRSESSYMREQERTRAEVLGMHFVSIPIGGFSDPTSEQLAQFFSLLRHSPSENIFIHCHYGEDRTGVFVAAYRLAFDHWTLDQAFSEMNDFGFHHTWHRGMGNFVRELPNRLQSDPILKAALN